MVLAAVVLSLMLGLIYLAQTIELGATRYEVQQLVRGREDLARQVQTIETTMLRWTAEPLVIERAQQAGLVPLAAKVRLPDR